MWVDIANLMGPKGADGADGQRGEPGPVNIGLNPDEPIAWDQSGGFTFQFVDGSEQTVNLPIASAQSAGLLGRDDKAAVDSAAYFSGWRNVSSFLTAGVSGNVFVARQGREVFLMMHNVASPTGGTTDIVELPAGFMPTSISGANWRNGVVSTDNGDTVRPVSFYNRRVRIINMASYKAFGGLVSFPVPRELPTSLPGTEA